MSDVTDAATPPAPSKTLRQRLPDFLVWGALALLLFIAFRPAHINDLPLLFQKSANMKELLSGFLHPTPLFCRVSPAQSGFHLPALFGWTNCSGLQFTWGAYVSQMWLTVLIAVWGTFIAILAAIPLGLLASRNITPPIIQIPVRRALDIVRSAPDLVLGMIFLVAVGPGPLAGVLALSINTSGVLAKLFSEAVESIDKGPVEGVRATGAARLHEIAWGVVPQVAPLWTSYALYRFESNSRSATVLGLIGAGGIGQLLFESLNAFKYSDTAAIVIVIIVAVSLIDMLSQAIRGRLL